MVYLFYHTHLLSLFKLVQLVRKTQATQVSDVEKNRTGKITIKNYISKIIVN